MRTALLTAVLLGIALGAANVARTGPPATFSGLAASRTSAPAAGLTAQTMPGMAHDTRRVDGSPADAAGGGIIVREPITPDVYPPDDEAVTLLRDVVTKVRSMLIEVQQTFREVLDLGLRLLVVVLRGPAP